ncbi:MAG: MerR family transcriptional regulator [Chloroflexota bacterium]
MSPSAAPTFNLKVVLKETGIAADTLRAWERRYGLPMPERTPGGHRLYSQRDIETIKWLMTKQGEGLSISRAVDLWKEECASGLDPLAAPRPTGVFAVPTANLASARQQWLEACLAFDEIAAEQAINQAFAMYPVETVCIELLQRGLHQIGEMWYTGEVTVQHEHFASGLIARRLDALIAATPLPTRPQTVLIGCPPAEWHTLPLLLMTLLLRRRGMNVFYLGANVPTERFEETLSIVRPNLVVLAAQQLHTAASLQETARYLDARGATVGYGGRIFNLRPELRMRIPAHFLGEMLGTSLETIENILSTKPAAPSVAPLTKPENRLLQDFKYNRPMIEFYLATEIHELGLPIEHMHIATQSLGDDLEAALALGTLDSVYAEMDWIRGLMQQRNITYPTLKAYLRAYAQSVEKAMGSVGQIVSDWLTAKAETGE